MGLVVRRLIRGCFWFVWLCGSLSALAYYAAPNFQWRTTLEMTLGAHQVMGRTTWKIYGPDLDGRYGGLNGTGGLDAIIEEPGVFQPLLNDARGNVLAYYDPTKGSNTGTAARPTGYGAVPGYRPLPCWIGANVAQSSAWRGRRPDVTGYIWLGARYYNPESGSFVSSDPVWNRGDPNYFTFGGGDPINGLDEDGRHGSAIEIPQIGPADPTTFADRRIYARDIAGGAADEVFNNVILAPFIPSDLSTGDLRAMGANGAPEVRMYDPLAQTAHDTAGSPLARTGFYDPNSSGAQWGQALVDAGLFVAAIDGAREQTRSGPVPETPAVWQDFLPDSRAQVNRVKIQYGDTEPYYAMDQGKPPLQRIHPDSTYESDPRAAASLEYQRGRSTEDIVRSLAPMEGNAEPLTTWEDGRLANGNTRVRVLIERGYDVNSLPRLVRVINPITLEETTKVVK